MFWRALPADIVGAAIVAVLDHGPVERVEIGSVALQRPVKPFTLTQAANGPLYGPQVCPEVEQLVGLSRATIYRKMRDGTFPRPRRTGLNSVRWPESALEQWKRELPFNDASP